MLFALTSLQALLFVIVIVPQKESLKRWCTIIVVRQVGSNLAFVILKNPKIFHPNDFVLLFDMYSINCVTIVADQGSF